ncbi:ATP:guanido phosphotransferase [Candidatus Omnitrophus magneticus]|uniref:Protein-arginine kinase n=1 Tax=Candidatus Omnitrophus magneticus TaxID=1609969 RepID=A0A0F0CRK2_9BACT|nr:ATP:guanido phosphotransferase [Candidatus Omnitrophus magneticus]
MRTDDFLQKKCEWTRGEGPDSSIVMSTRVRLARNLSGHFFWNWADGKQQNDTMEKVLTALKKTRVLKNSDFIKMKDTSLLDREFFIERHLMSKNHLVNVENKSLVVNNEEIISLMVNEEDHLRLQIIRSGKNIIDAWKIAETLDTEISSYLNFAFSNKLGYLTACPTNTGTGLRASVMMHLPALQMTDQMENVYDAISKLGLTIRGFYGEGSDASGNFFQISNQVSLGHSEVDILDNLERVVNKIIVREQDTRMYLLNQKKQETVDGVFRSYGTLKSARIMTSMETIKLLSIVRMGVALGIVKDISINVLNEILLLSQPAHLQKLNKRELSSQERDIKRADLTRKMLGGVE